LLEATIRRALELARASVTARDALFPQRAGRPEPFYVLLTEGERVPLDDYARLDEAHVMSLMAAWRDNTIDPTLAELATAYKTRRFPKMVRLAIETTALSPDDWRAATDEARAIFQRHHPERDPRYFVHFDEPERLSYKRYSAGGGAPPIRVTAAGGGARTIESDPRSIANNISTRMYFPRLFVPEAIRAEVENALAARPT
jgi:hypothetical protein